MVTTTAEICFLLWREAKDVYRVAAHSFEANRSDAVITTYIVWFLHVQWNEYFLAVNDALTKPYVNKGIAVQHFIDFVKAHHEVEWCFGGLLSLSNLGVPAYYFLGRVVEMSVVLMICHSLMSSVFCSKDLSINIEAKQDLVGGFYFQNIKSLDDQLKEV